MHRPFEITDGTIVVRLCHFITKNYRVVNQEFLIESLSRHWRQHTIRFIGEDGENVETSGFLDLVNRCQTMFNISDDHIEFQLNVPVPRYRLIPEEWAPFYYASNHMKLGIKTEFEPNLQKFVGVLNSSRLSLARMLMTYSIGTKFVNDCYITMDLERQNALAVFDQFQDSFVQEIEWFRTATFMQPDIEYISPHGPPCVSGWTASGQYHATHQPYAIEVVMETDEFNGYWLTEKTAKALAHGKPFVMLSGQHSLDYLKTLGYATFDSIIDESYDQSPEPFGRIQKIVESLSVLHDSPDRADRIRKMYDIAEHNKNQYREAAQRWATTYQHSKRTYDNGSTNPGSTSLGPAGLVGKGKGLVERP